MQDKPIDVMSDFSAERLLHGEKLLKNLIRQRTLKSHINRYDQIKKNSHLFRQAIKKRPIEFFLVSYLCENLFNKKLQKKIKEQIALIGHQDMLNYQYRYREFVCNTAVFFNSMNDKQRKDLEGKLNDTSSNGVGLCALETEYDTAGFFQQKGFEVCFGEASNGGRDFYVTKHGQTFEVEVKVRDDSSGVRFSSDFADKHINHIGSLFNRHRPRANEDSFFVTFDDDFKKFDASKENLSRDETRTVVQGPGYTAAFLVPSGRFLNKDHAIKEYAEENGVWPFSYYDSSHIGVTVIALFSHERPEKFWEKAVRVFDGGAQFEEKSRGIAVIRVSGLDIEDERNLCNKDYNAFSKISSRFDVFAAELHGVRSSEPKTRFAGVIYCGTKDYTQSSVLNRMGDPVMTGRNNMRFALSLETVGDEFGNLIGFEKD